MKLNFWQWIGLIVFVIALILIIRRELGAPDRQPAPTAPAAAPTAPAEPVAPSTSPAL